MIPVNVFFKILNQVSVSKRSGLGCSKAGNFNPGLGKNSTSSFFFKKRLTILLEYCLDIQRKLPKLQFKSFSERLETKPWVKYLTLGWR